MKQNEFQMAMQLIYIFGFKTKSLIFITFWKHSGLNLELVTHNCFILIEQIVALEHWKMVRTTGKSSLLMKLKFLQILFKKTFKLFFSKTK